ncbi:hypothetical protein SBD_0771 [Streptomyces bottropensis ATCC 25435]|uniref:Uncharacterized protein n=1 Tax=Streptomyces bottropensis ATCC 25435 TaxID=1054862 RepID=M3F8V3_9ACTN|nr:hypothetical protein SBD_0771 [Streptomyces bottropensis ATCC 25435]
MGGLWIVYGVGVFCDHPCIPREGINGKLLPSLDLVPPRGIVSCEKTRPRRRRP